MLIFNLSVHNKNQWRCLLTGLGLCNEQHSPGLSVFIAEVNESGYMEEELNKVMQNQQHQAQPVQTGKHIINGLNMSVNAVLVFKKCHFGINFTPRHNQVQQQPIKNI